jgi:hypothetical protein
MDSPRKELEGSIGTPLLSSAMKNFKTREVSK